MGVSVIWRACSSVVTRPAAAPSLNGHASYSLRGAATTYESSTSLTVISLWKCAVGLCIALRWFWMATCARSSSVVPYCAMCARAMAA
jgi:hypothetical protein